MAHQPSFSRGEGLASESIGVMGRNAGVEIVAFVIVLQRGGTRDSGVRPSRWPSFNNGVGIWQTDSYALESLPLLGRAGCGTNGSANAPPGDGEEITT